jgi:hypothetical protein
VLLGRTCKASQHQYCCFSQHQTRCMQASRGSTLASKVLIMHHFFWHVDFGQERDTLQEHKALPRQLISIAVALAGCRENLRSSTDALSTYLHLSCLFGMFPPSEIPSAACGAPVVVTLRKSCCNRCRRCQRPDWVGETICEIAC